MTNTNYPIGNFLISVKNAAMAKNKKVTSVANKQIVALAESLKKSGYFDDVKKEGKNITASLSFKNKKPVIMNLKLVSKPGLRIYLGASDIEKKRGPSIYLISTPQGILSSREALKKRIGGEVIAEIW